MQSIEIEEDGLWLRRGRKQTCHFVMSVFLSSSSVAIVVVVHIRNPLVVMSGRNWDLLPTLIGFSLVCVARSRLARVCAAVGSCESGSGEWESNCRFLLADRRLLCRGWSRGCWRALVGRLGNTCSGG